MHYISIPKPNTNPIRNPRNVQTSASSQYSYNNNKQMVNTYTHHISWSFKQPIFFLEWLQVDFKELQKLVEYSTNNIKVRKSK